MVTGAGGGVFKALSRGDRAATPAEMPALALSCQGVEGADVTWPLQVTTEIRSGPAMK